MSYYLKLTIGINDDDKSTVSSVKARKTIIFSHVEELHDDQIMLKYDSAYDALHMLEAYVMPTRAQSLRISDVKMEFELPEYAPLHELLRRFIDIGNVFSFSGLGHDIYSRMFNYVAKHDGDEIAHGNEWSKRELIKRYIAACEKAEAPAEEPPKVDRGMPDGTYEFDENAFAKTTPENAEELKKMVNSPRETVADVLDSQEFKDAYKKLEDADEHMPNSVFDVVNESDDEPIEQHEFCKDAAKNLPENCLASEDAN